MSIQRPKYQRCGTIGTGAYAEVSLLKNVSTNSYTALKMINKKTLKTKDLLLIMNEIIILKSLNNIFINKIKNDVDEVKSINILLEYESGGDLHSVFTIKLEEKISESDALFYIAEIALGVEYLHSKDVIHRDLKLENIFISGSGHIKIGDFGFACIATRCIDICGTYGYLCPEIIQNKPYTNKVDIWCIGVIAYELVYGKNPFEEDFNNDDLTNRNTLALKYEVDDKKLYINDFLEDILIEEEKRCSITELIRSPWLQSINLYKLRNGTYIGKIPYRPKKKYQNPKTQLNFINKLIQKSNEYIPIVIFDTENDFKCIGYNSYFKTIFHITKDDLYLSNFLSNGPNFKCLQKIKQFLDRVREDKFLHTKYLKRQDCDIKIKCGIDTAIISDDVGKRLLYSKIIPIELG